MKRSKNVNKRLRKFLGLWWIEPIEETIQELGKVPYRHVPSRPLPPLQAGCKPRVTRVG
jgi:hypothetical protein